MKIGILGSGNMGQGLGRLWAKAGHEVGYSYTRDLARLARQIAQQGPHVRAGEVADIVSAADVLLISAHWSRMDDIIRQAGSVAGKVLISCSNPMTNDDSALAVGHTVSGAELLAQKLTGSRFVFGFNTLPAELLQALAKHPLEPRPDVVMCGDDHEAKSVAFELARDAGLSPRDAGPLRVARYLEPFSLLVGQLAYAADADPRLSYRFSSIGRQS